MNLWDALPWNTIGIIIGISLLIPSLLTIFLIRKKRFEELGWAIGVFLLILSVVTYAYIIPQEIVDEAMIPENYIWEDIGDIYYWERNSVVFPEEIRFNIPSRIADAISKRDPIERNFRGKEVIHVTHFNRYENKAIINDALYDENGEVLRVINGREQVSEWYEVDTHLTSLKYVSVEAGRMGIPSNPDGLGLFRVGWVDSEGDKNGGENVVVIRDMKRIKTGFIEGIEFSVWQSDFYNLPIVWHGESYICDETLRMTVHSKTGYVIHVYRHLVLSARLSQFIEIYHPELLNNRFVNRFLKNNNPIGEAAELIYETTEESQAKHIAEAKAYDNMITYLPIAIFLPMFIFGMAFVWRYSGRSYYWRRYKDFNVNSESTPKSTPKETKRSRSPVTSSNYMVRRLYKKASVFFVCFLLLFSSIVYFIIIPIQRGDELFFFKPDEKSVLIEEIPPTPPGSQRTFDSGRHALEPQDEAQHSLSKREWWYFNVFFDNPASDLNGWSMIVSFNKMARNDIKFLRRDNLFIILYDDKGTSYSFNTLNKRRGTLQAGGPGVDVKFQKSWARGQYPNWQVHAENEASDIIIDLNFTADFMPVWVEGRSTNLFNSGTKSGDYYIPRCKVEGTITWNNENHVIYGKGYHDHVWESYIPRFITKGWDWIQLHFDNGWEMYISKFSLRWPRNKHVGALIISPNNGNIVEWAEFKLEYVESARAQILPSISYPTKYYCEARSGDMVLSLEITVYNLCEIVFKTARTGMFEGPCYAKGTFSWSDYTVELDGYGMSEVTRVEYLLDILNPFKRIRERLSTLFP